MAVAGAVGVEGVDRESRDELGLRPRAGQPCAAFADASTTLFCPETNRDIEATMGCLNALGADITRTDSGYRVVPVKEIPRQTALRCHDSGSTLRFLLPVAGALGIDTEQVGVKATTEEGLGFTGDGSGMSAHAVALIEHI